MKFIHYLESITGVGIYPMASFLIFFLFFLVVSIYLLKAGKNHFNDMARIPLDVNQTSITYEER